MSGPGIGGHRRTFRTNRRLLACARRVSAVLVLLMPPTWCLPWRDRGPPSPRLEERCSDSRPRPARTSGRGGDDHDSARVERVAANVSYRGVSADPPPPGRAGPEGRLGPAGRPGPADTLYSASA